MVAFPGATEFTLAYPPHPLNGERVPNERQALAHACPADVILYGGARGGGKTEFLGMQAAVHGLNYPGIQMLIVRRTRDEMKMNVIPVLRRILRGIAKWKKQDHAFEFFNGSLLIVDFLQKEDDIGRYLGSEFGWIGVDQAEQLTEWTVAGLLSCIRSTQPWPKQLILTANPGVGLGVPWLRRWFIKPIPRELGGRRTMPRPFEVWRPKPREDDPTPPEQVPTRCFIPARFQDNPALQAGDPTYLARIYQAFRAESAKAQAEGNWDSNDALLVGKLWSDRMTVSEELAARYDGRLTAGQEIQWHVIDNPKWRPASGCLIYGSIDYGYGAPCSIHLHAAMPGGHTRTFLEFYKSGVQDTGQAQALKWMLEQNFFANSTTPLIEGLQWVVYDPSMVGSRKEQGLAKSIIEVYQEINPKVSFLSGAGGRSARMSRPGRWLDALATAPDGFPWWNVTTACPDLIRTVPEIPPDPDDLDVEDPDSENHAYEDTGRFFEARPHSPRVAPPDPWQHLDPISAAHQRALAAKANPKKGSSLRGFAKR